MGNEKAELLTNENLKRALLNRGNISPLEELLAAEISKLERLQRLLKQGKLNFGPVLPAAQLEGMLAEVKEDVDRFLGVNEVNAPDIKYNGLMRFGRQNLTSLIGYGVGTAGLLYGIPKSLEGSWVGWFVTALGSGTLIRAALDHLKISKKSFYDISSGTIVLARNRRASITTVVGHEYAHHVQKISGLEGREYSIAMEGHATGIASHVALHYREKEGNESFLFGTTSRNVRQLKEAYRWLCKELGVNPRKSLDVAISTNDLTDDIFGRAVFGSTTHALGSAVVYLCESARGLQVYREILQGKFQFAAAK